jgi:purine nucleosidase
VAAITTVAGNVDLETATANAQRIVSVAWAGRSTPPLFAGQCRAGATAEDVHGLDGLGGASTRCDPQGRLLYPAAAPVADEPAAEAIVRLARAHPGEVSLVTLGPLTNVAAALALDREAAGLLREVVVMGGAFRETGNVTATAEFNIYVDPEAAQVLCESGLPVRWVPVDVTHRCLITEADLAALPDTPHTRFIRAIAACCLEFHHTHHGERAFFLHDPVAVAAVLWPELLRAAPLQVNVETEGRLTRGMTVADLRPAAYRRGLPNAYVCLDVDARTMVRRILARLGS